MSKIFAKCTNPKVDYLTDWKLYEVIEDCLSTDGTFETERDDGEMYWFDWKASWCATWERVEQQDPPQWALDKAAKAVKWCDYKEAKSIASEFTLAAIIAHAATLAKYETEPVDPDVLAVRSIIEAAKNAKVKPRNVGFFGNGHGDHTPYFQAALAAYRASKGGDQ